MSAASIIRPICRRATYLRHSLKPESPLFMNQTQLEATQSRNWRSNEADVVSDLHQLQQGQYPQGENDELNAASLNRSEAFIGLFVEGKNLFLTTV